MLANNSCPMGPEAYARQAEAYLKFDALDGLDRITAPTLVIVGEQDRLTPPWVVSELASAIPGARFEIIKGGGSSHAALLERPDEFNQLVTEFLAS